jgi:hypothetical protein
MMRRRPTRSVAGILAACSLVAACAFADPNPAPTSVESVPTPPAADPATATMPLRPQDASEVHIERIKPKREKHPTLRFLKENRDFIRARFDLLREEPGKRAQVAEELDPRYLAYQQMLAAVMAGTDSVNTAEAERQRQQLMASVTMLGDLEAQLDQIERALAAQRLRLGMLQEDFTGDQRTALVIVVGGHPADGALTEIVVTLEDGQRTQVPLTPEHQASLRRGGVIQVFHRFVEPREQMIEVEVASSGRPEADRGYVTLEPARNQITFLRLNLTDLHGKSGMSASTWLHDTRVPPVGG